MCGIFGIVYNKEIAKAELMSKMDKMSKISKYRGPDQGSIKVFGNAAIGMNRLSILEPDANCTINESMSSNSYAVFNGEISNYLELDMELKGKCDSSIILPLYEKYKDFFVKKLAGMFAIAIYDNATKSLKLYRDQLGIKPLYYCITDECFIFASEIKMIYSVLDRKPTINISAIDHILRYRFEPGEGTVFNEIKKVLPGQIVRYDDKRIIKEKYWTLKNNNEISEKEYTIEGFNELLQQVVNEHLISDVKGGFFTSGGLDSSLITAIAMKDASNYQQPISIKFQPNSVIDEVYGKKLEEYIGVTFEWVTIDDRLARKTLLDIVQYLDEPLENPTHIGTYLMAKRAKELGIKTVITGDGSDEFFLGYERQACWLKEKNPVEIYPSLCVTMKDSEREIYREEIISHILPMIDGRGRVVEPISNMNDALIFEREERLPEYHNMRLDRMTMANSVEAKVPFLDRRIVEYSLHLSHQELHGTNGKAWLKKVAERWLPNEIIYRNKVLFPSLPDQWISGEGIEWISEILLYGRVASSNLFKRDIVEKYIKEHSIGKIHRGKLLWALAVLELWLNNLDNWVRE